MNKNGVTKRMNGMVRNSSFDTEQAATLFSGESVIVDYMTR